MKKLSPNKFLFTLLMAVLSGASCLAESIQTSQANVREEPDKNSRIVATLPRGAEVTLIKREAQYALVKAASTGRTGWVYAPAQGWTFAVAAAADVVNPTSASEMAITVATAPPSTSPSPERTLPLPAYDLSSGTPPVASEIRLEMDAHDAEALFLKDPNDKSTFPVRLRDSGSTLEGEVAVKGSFTRRYLKKSLLITLPKGQSWQGRRRIALNAMATDPTQAREWLSWDLARTLGLRVPQTSYRKLYVNDRYLGLYLDIEWMDEAMFSRMGLAGGEFYQPDDTHYCGDFAPANLARINDCWSKLFPKTGGLDALQTLGQGLNDAPTENFDVWLEQHFDVQSVIDWLLINTLAQNGDTYNKNYFLHYAPEQKKWRVIPWDYDLSWGRVADAALPYPQNVHNDFFQYLYPPVIGAENPLKTKTLKNPRLYARFQARLKEVLTPGSTPASGWFDPARFQRNLANIKALMEPSLAQEAYPAQQLGTPALHFESLAFFNEWRYHTLQALLLEASPFDTPRWLPYTSYDPLTPVTPENLKQRKRHTLELVASAMLPPGKKVPVMEKLLAYPLAFATLRAGQPPAKLSIETDREAAPDSLPPETHAAQCVERSWFVTLKSEHAARVDLQLDYLHESSTRHELGNAIQDESRLALWRHDGKTWQVTGAALNPLSNSFSAEGQQLEPGVLNRYVACLSNQDRRK